MAGSYANMVSACEAYGTEGVEARNVMNESRANVDVLSLVWRTSGELLRLEIGLDARTIGLSFSERMEKTSFLTSPLIGLIEAQNRHLS